MSAIIVLKNTFFLSVIQLANFITPILILPYLTRVFDVNEFGLIAFVLSSLALCNVITDFGFMLSATYRVAQLCSLENRENLNKFIGSIYFAKIPLVLIACGILLLVPFFNTYYSQYQDYFFVACIAVIFQAFQPYWFFQGLEKMRRITICMVWTKCLYALFVLFFVKNNDDGMLVIWGWGLAQAAGALLALKYIYQEGYSVIIPSLDEVKQSYRHGAQFFYSRIAVSLYTSASIFILGFTGNVGAVALYSVCEQMYKGGQAMLSPVAQSLYPYMTKNKNFSLFFRLTSLVGLCVVFGCVFMMFWREELLAFFAGNSYKSASDILFIFLITSIVNYFGVVYGYPLYAAINKTKYANYSVIIGALLHTCLLFYLFSTQNLTCFNVAICILMTELFVLGLRVAMFFKLNNGMK